MNLLLQYTNVKCPLSTGYVCSRHEHGGDANLWV